MSRTRGDVWRLAVASAASNTGNWAATVALSLVAYAKTGFTVWLAGGLELGTSSGRRVLSRCLSRRQAARGAENRTGRAPG